MKPAESLEPGAQAQAGLQVGAADLASALRLQAGDDFPPVFATARMIALMEIAAARVLLPLVEQGEMSVGVTVEVTHSAATLAGETVRAEARFVQRVDKLFEFEVVAFDAAGEIGRGTHRRAIVLAERLLTGADKRRAAGKTL